MTDAELLHRYAHERADDAFGELVRRRIDFVYAAALRQLAGDHHRAEDVAQQVFIDLARKARSLARHPDLLGWLHTSTRFAALQVIRSEQRRRRREQRHAMEQPAPASPETDIRPVLDAALHELNDRDRRIVLLRFFSDESYASIGTQLGSSENAVQKSVERALDKLQAALRRRGITTTTAVLTAGLISGSAASAAPAGLASAVTQAALASALANSGASLFVMTAATKTTLVAAGAALATAVGFLFHQRTQTRDALAAAANWEKQSVDLRAEIETVRTRAAAAEQRAQAADLDNALLLKAVAARPANQSPPAAADKRSAKDLAALSRTEALAEARALVEGTEKLARQEPGYQPYQAPNELSFPPAMLEQFARTREAARLKNQTAFLVLSDTGSPYFIHVPSLTVSPYVKLFPQLTRDDWLPYDERFGLALVERMQAQNRSRASKAAR